MTSSSLVGESFFCIDLGQLWSRLQGMRRHVSKRVLLLEFAPDGLRVAEARFSELVCNLTTLHFSLCQKRLRARCSS